MIWVSSLSRPSQPCPAPFLTTRFVFDASLLELFDDQLGLLKRNESILITVDDQCGWVVGGNVRDTGEISRAISSSRLGSVIGTQSLLSLSSSR